MEIIRGTTPTIQFTFSTIEPEDVSAAYLILKQGCRQVFEKDLAAAKIIDGKLSFTLSQEETLQLHPGETVYITLDWKTSGGTRGRSRVFKSEVADSGKEGTF